MYSKKLVREALNPKNIGELKNPDAIGKIGNPRCGDIIWIYIKIKSQKTKKIIQNIKFKTFGCFAAIASSSILTQIAKGKTIEQAKKISSQQIIKKLGGLPDIKFHCSEMVVQALKKAIQNYETKISSKP